MSGTRKSDKNNDMALKGTSELWDQLAHTLPPVPGAPATATTATANTEANPTTKPPVVSPVAASPFSSGALSASSSSGGGEVDIWRKTWLRFMGYTNEVGEAFRPLLPRLVAPSYAIAGLYVLGDTVDKTSKASKDPAGAPAALVGIDVLLWQLFASVLLPGLTINRAVAATSFVLRSAPLPPPVKRGTPVVVGLSLIPFIIHPIDTFVSSMMNRTYRRLAGTEMEELE